MWRHRFFCAVAFVMLAFVAQGGASVDLYGYMSLYYENVGPMSNSTAADDKGDPGEFAFANLNLMLNSQVTDRVRAYINLKGTDDIVVQNYWGEYAFSDQLKLRTGKIYRPFDQYNELLDAVPTYLGMEPPELFDKDHLMLPRFGKVMLHGGKSVGSNYLRYAYMLDSDEKMLSSNNEELTLSHSWDVNFNWHDILTVGHSGFLANEQNGSGTDLGDGSPKTGMLPWMATDKYNVFGGYFRAKVKGLTLKGAYWTSAHQAERDPLSVVTVYRNTTLNASQLNNFFGSSTYSKALTETDSSIAADVATTADYTVSTYYAQMGYTIGRGTIGLPVLRSLEITPYFFWDYYSNPETIAKKTWGGDNEAGVSDDGQFSKATVGIAIKPSPFVALKIDGGPHLYKTGGEDVRYNEFRMDFSYFFQ